MEQRGRRSSFGHLSTQSTATLTLVPQGAYVVSEILQAISVALSSLMHPCQGLNLWGKDPGNYRSPSSQHASPLHPRTKHPQPGRLPYLHNLIFMGAQVRQTVLIGLLLLVASPLRLKPSKMTVDTLFPKDPRKLKKFPLGIMSKCNS